MPYRNVIDSLQRFRNLQRDYDTDYETRIQRLRTEYATTRGRKATLRESLEYHVRVYLINAWLDALNWRMDVTPEAGLPNMVPEAPVAPLLRGKTRFLDYFGFERDVIDRPLLIVETKRTSSMHPRLRAPDEPASSETEAVARGLRGESMMDDWNAWLNDLRDYVRRVHARVQTAPSRAVITNGRWLVLFLDPADAFLPGGRQSHELILVFLTPDEIDARYAELYRHLEYSSLSGIVEPLQPAEAAFFVDTAKIARAMHGLRVRYVAAAGNVRGPTPLIKVTPWLFLGSDSGSWISVRGDDDFDMPTRRADFAGHLAEVDTAAKALLREVNARLGVQLQPSAIEEHYSLGLPGLRSVQEVDRELYLVVTGRHTHYFRAQPSHAGCRWHSWAEASSADCGVPDGPYLRGRVTPRSFFHQPEDQFCAHSTVQIVKRTALSPTNRASCGTRSGVDGSPFCEVWAFEQQMCCRTCVFEMVCGSARVFQLPCPPVSSPPPPALESGPDVA